MRVAWFRPPAVQKGFDDLVPVIDGLRATHAIDVVDARAAHDFVWQMAQGRYDLSVYELDDTAAHQYIWAYLLHYPGVLALRSSRLHDGRAIALAHQHRDADRLAEMQFADGPVRREPPWPLVRGAWSSWRIPVLASRATAVSDAALASAIAETCPDARVMVTPAGVVDPLADSRSPATSSGVVRVLVAEGSAVRTVERAAARARDAGAAVELVTGDTGARDVLLSADVVVATRWPTLGRPLVPALRAAAAGRAVVVADTESTARWPTLDPQTWQPRAIAIRHGRAEPAMAVSIDPRDEEHSLMVALVRLSSEPELRASLGRAARAWWERHATVPHAVEAWQRVLTEAVMVPAPSRPAGWPSHLDDDGSRRAREVLAPFGLDFRM
jgi:hypothetical protein